MARGVLALRTADRGGVCYWKAENWGVPFWGIPVETMKTVLFLIAGKRNFAAITPHAV